MRVKTNAMRLLQQAAVPFVAHSYPVDESDLSGVHAAHELGIAPGQLFKTLVLHGEPGGYFVCCIPANEEIDLKKAAALRHDKKCELLPLKELLPLTGYLRGGCSPIGMKKQLPTLFEESIILHPSVYISAGVRGTMLQLAPQDLLQYLQCTTGDLLR